MEETVAAPDPRRELADDLDGDAEDTGQHESLDDDAFFASLRDAVRDDEVGLGDEDQTDFFEQGGPDPDEERKLFRRRR